METNIGFAAGPPAIGAIIDVPGPSALAWNLVEALFGAVTAVTVGVRRLICDELTRREGVDDSHRHMVRPVDVNCFLFMY